MGFFVLECNMGRISSSMGVRESYFRQIFQPSYGLGWVRFDSRCTYKPFTVTFWSTWEVKMFVIADGIFSLHPGLPNIVPTYRHIIPGIFRFRTQLALGTLSRP